MDDKRHILDALSRNKPADQPMPSMKDLQRLDLGDRIEQFRAVVEEVGAEVVEVERSCIRTTLAQQFPDAVRIASTLPEYKGVIDLSAVDDPKALADLEVVVCEGVLGVSENGAIWVPERRMVHRVAPFITQHLVVVLDQLGIVRDMHDAYEHINASEEGFGVFISGPSKTADIEQSLVLGAHGPRTMKVYLV